MIRTTQFRLLWALAPAAFLGGLTNLPGAAFERDAVEFFEKKIRPVLADRCYECHSHQSKKLKGGLYLDSRAGLLQGGDTGVAVVLGEPEKSRLIEAVSYTNPDLQMPPKEKLPDGLIAALKEWIKMGAPWPEELQPKPTEGQNEDAAKKEQALRHWAWQPVQARPEPAVKNKQWPRTPIDRFLLAKLEEKQLAPAPPADRRTLIRRVYFNLTGLPPAPEEVERFVADPNPQAFAKVVDQLLASPHYGERMAREWLDIARYGEDQAHSFQPRLYPQGYRYRDWVVRAFNDDLPYDRFVQEQIAADLIDGPDRLERLAALGFFALGPVYYGDKKMFDQYDDRIDTLTRGFLGLTVACARCHDHKYDPITSRDYYALAGIFASSAYVETPLASKEVIDKYEQAQKAIELKSKEIDAFLGEELARLQKTLTLDIARSIVAAWKLSNQRKIEPKKSAEELAKSEGLPVFVLDRWGEYLKAKRDRPYLAPWRQLQARQDPVKDLTADEAALAEVRKFAGTFQDFVVSTRKLRDALSEQSAAAAALSPDEKAPKLALEKTQVALLEELFGNEGVLTVSKNQAEKLLSYTQKSSLSQLRAALDELKKAAPPKYAAVHTLKESDKLSNLTVLIRGNPETAGPEVPRGFISLLAGGGNCAFTNGSGRLELAAAITSTNNPLTARVMVNRIWQHHFGAGLVRTPSNFGMLGEPPSNPELLDYLADQFMRQGWSIKWLHRQILHSAAYQMSSRAHPGNQEIDPENKFLWRMNRRRLEVELWRDGLLAVAGNLDPTIGGPSVKLSSPDNRRRTCYAAISRHDLDSLLRLFDFPDPNVTSDKRTVTTVPLQQLFVLNSEFMVRQAKALAQRLTANVEESDPLRVRRAFLTVYGRPPTEEENKIALKFLAAPVETESANQAGNAPAFSRWEQYAQVLLSANEFMYVD